MSDWFSDIAVAPRKDAKLGLRREKTFTRKRMTATGSDAPAQDEILQFLKARKAAGATVTMEDLRVHMQWGTRAAVLACLRRMRGSGKLTPDLESLLEPVGSAGKLREYVHVQTSKRTPPPQRAKVLAFVTDELAAGRPFPTPVQVQIHMGWKTPQSATHALDGLVGDGYVVRAYEGGRKVIYSLAESQQ